MKKAKHQKASYYENQDNKTKHQKAMYKEKPAKQIEYNKMRYQGKKARCKKVENFLRKVKQ